MRTVLIAAATALAVAACSPSAPSGQSDQPSAGDVAASVFPNLFQTAYRAEATITGENGSTMPVVMIRDGAKMRMEMTTAQGPVATIMNRDTGETFVIMHAMGRTMALRNNVAEADRADMWWDNPEVAASMTHAGPCAHLGETGVEWERQSESGPQHTCVTGDGIILWATDNGRTTWQTTSITRGAQDASLFALPDGVQVTDLGQMGAGMAEAMAAAKAQAQNR